jgi:predicted phosphodiesterase
MAGNGLSRREFLKLAGAASLALALPPGARALAAQTHADTRFINDISLGRIAAADNLSKVTFAFMSDTHVPFDDRGVMKTIVNECNARDLDMVVHGGDGVQMGNSHSFASFLKYVRGFKAPFFMAPGNHDTAFTDYKDLSEWTSRFGNPFFMFDTAHVRFILLNNSNFELDEPQWSFFEKALTTDRPAFVAMHRPVAGLNPWYDTPMKQSDRFRDMVRRLGPARVLNGHEHHYERYEADGTVYITSGGAGGRLNQDPTGGNFHHFMVLRVDGDRIEEEIVRV